jgi:hypothetical protein
MRPTPMHVYQPINEDADGLERAAISEQSRVHTHTMRADGGSEP